LTHDIILIISEQNPHAPAVGNRTILALMFVDDLAIGSFTIHVLQKGINQMVKCCNKSNLKLNVNKFVVMVFIEPVKLEKKRILEYVWSNIGGSKTFIYLGVNLDSSGERRRQR
jgi:Reverse transcriptase (RNA-dependent DNA polymerase).